LINNKAMMTRLQVLRKKFKILINYKIYHVNLAYVLLFLAYAGWLSFGGLINRPYVYSYPVTTAGCNITDENLLGNISSPVYDPSTWNPQSHYRYFLIVMTIACLLILPNIIAVLENSLKKMHHTFISSNTDRKIFS